MAIGKPFIINALVAFLLMICLFLVAASAQTGILPRPEPPTLVTDAAHLLTPAETSALENKLVALDNSTSNQIAIVTIPTLNGMDIADYSNKLLRAWGIGTKKNNNGVLILIANQEHKIRIEVGSGLEGAIPDVTAKSIIDNDLSPNFKSNNYYQGFDLATTDLGKAATGEYNIQQNTKPSSNKSGIIIFLFVGAIIFFIIRGFMGRGGGGGGMISRRGSGLLTGLLLGNLLGGGGGFSGGGGFGGGGGGGFGGFGGGGGGGGGASGGW